MGWQSAVANIFAQEGVPAADWQSIATYESGMNPSKINLRDPNGGSWGLFQLNLGGQGAAYKLNPNLLLNPILNSNIASPPIAKAYAEGLSRGYTGANLAEYTATHSGHPGYAPAGSILPPFYWPSYRDYALEASGVAASYNNIVSGGYNSQVGGFGIPPNVSTGGAGVTLFGTTASASGANTWASMLKTLYKLDSPGIFNLKGDVVSILYKAGLILAGLIIMIIGLTMLVDFSSIAKLAAK